MNDFDVGKYFSTVGKKVTILFTVNILFVGLIVALFIWFFNATTANENKLVLLATEKETFELKALRESKELDDLSMVIAEYQEVVGEKDLNKHLLNSLSKVEELTLKHSLKNSEHEVSELTKLNEIPSIPFLLTVEGDYLNVMRFVEELNQATLPITLRDISLYVVEEDYEKRFKGTKNVELNLLVYVFEDITLIEKKTENLFAAVQELSSPFGFFVYKHTEEAKSGIEEYQDFLQQYAEAQAEEEAKKLVEPIEAPIEVVPTENAPEETETTPVPSSEDIPATDEVTTDSDNGEE